MIHRVNVNLGRSDSTREYKGAKLHVYIYIYYYIILYLYFVLIYKNVNDAILAKFSQQFWYGWMVAIDIAMDLSVQTISGSSWYFAVFFSI